MLNETNTNTFPVPIFSDNSFKTFSGTKCFRYRFRDFFGTNSFPIMVPIPPKKWKIPGTGTYTVLVPIINFKNSLILATKISSGTKFFRYRFRDFFPVPSFPDTSSETFFRYQIFSDTGSETFLCYHKLNIVFRECQF